jgi:uncharacterized damage-inducible protein DinB
LNPQAQHLLDVFLDSWDRSNTILLNLLRLLPKAGLSARATPTSPTVSEMLAHIHHERMVSLLEEAPEFAGKVPEQEWQAESDPECIAQLLAESARRVQAAVKSKVEKAEPMNLEYDHPILLLQLLIFHEAYHHGQIKLALKIAGCPIPDDQAGPLTWNVWRMRRNPT